MSLHQSTWWFYFLLLGTAGCGICSPNGPISPGIWLPWHRWWRGKRCSRKKVCVCVWGWRLQNKSLLLCRTCTNQHCSFVVVAVQLWSPVTHVKLPSFVFTVSGLHFSSFSFYGFWWITCRQLTHFLWFATSVHICKHESNNQSVNDRISLTD